jgi:hypothetical protein
MLLERSLYYSLSTEGPLEDLSNGLKSDLYTPNPLNSPVEQKDWIPSLGY